MKIAVFGSQNAQEMGTDSCLSVTY